MVDYADRHEADIAELLGGQVVPQSGAGAEKLDARAPRDGHYWRWRASCKATVTARICVTRSTLQEMVQAVRASSAEERALLALRFYDARGRHVLYDLIAVTTDDWAEREAYIASLEDEIARLRGGEVDERGG